MPDETNDQFGHGDAATGTSDQWRDGSEVRKKAEDQGMYGQVSTQNTANAAPPEEEPVGSNRPEPRAIRKMNASDFKVRQEPKPAPEPPVHEHTEHQHKPAEHASAQEPIAAAPAQPPHEHVHRDYEPHAAHEPHMHNHAYVEPEPAGYQYDGPAANPKGSNFASRGITDAIKGSLSFFTIFPIHAGEREIQAMNRSFYLVPLVGLIIGLIVAAIGVLFAELRVGAAFSAIAVLGTTYIISKFLHFDGLVDFGDGMISSGDREGRIRALKDTRIGAGGLGIALIVVLALYAGLVQVWGAFALSAVIVTMEVFAKNSMVAAAAFGEPGDGMASEQVRNTNVIVMMTSTIISAGLAFAGYLLMGLIVSNTIMMGMWTTPFIMSAAIVIAAAAVSSVFVGWLTSYLSNKKFGFVNGDVLGATNEIAKVMILFIAILVIQFYLMPEIWNGGGVNFTF